MNSKTLTLVPGAETRYDDDGKEIVRVVTCGHCGRSWNDAAISGVTPVPAGRCPFEYEHVYDDAEEVTPVIVVTRHPDYSDEINIYGTEAKLIYLDLGASFNTTPDDEDQAREWAQGTWDEVKDLPADHPARAEVREVIRYTVENYFHGEALDALLDEGGE